MVIVEDIVAARKALYEPDAALSKLRKPELVSVVSAYWWFLRELRGAPSLFDTVMDLARSEKGGCGIAKATNAINMQDGLDTDRVRSAYAVTFTSTQASNNVSPPNPDVSMISRDAAAATDASGKVEDEDNNEGRTHSCSSAPIPAPPHVTAAGVVVGGDVDAAPDGVVAPHGGHGEGGEQQQKQNGAKHGHKRGVCKFTWQRKKCTKPGCLNQHPTLCYNPTCADGRAKNCKKFHGSAIARAKEEGGRHIKNQGNEQRGARRSPYNTGNISKRTNGNKTFNRSTVELCKAREKVAKLQLQLEKAKEKQVWASTSSNGNYRIGNGNHSSIGSGRVQHRVDLAGIIAKAVGAALAGIV